MGTSPYNNWTLSRIRRQRQLGTQPAAITDPFQVPKSNALYGANEAANMMSVTDYNNNARLQQEANKAAAAAQQALAIAQYNNQTRDSTNPYVTGTQAASSTQTGTRSSTGSSTRTTVPQGDVMDGFARRYLPNQVDNILQNPTIISQDLLGGAGKGALVGDAARYANAAPALFNLLLGGNMAPGVQDNDDIINYVAKLMGDMATVGGRTPNVQQLVSQFYAGLNDKDSTIAADLYDDKGNPVDSSSQVDTINKMIPLLGVFSNYNYSNAMQKQAARLGQEYLAAKAKGGMNNVTYAQYLQDNFLR